MLGVFTTFLSLVNKQALVNLQLCLSSLTSILQPDILGTEVHYGKTQSTVSTHEHPHAGPLTEDGEWNSDRHLVSVAGRNGRPTSQNRLQAVFKFLSEEF